MSSRIKLEADSKSFPLSSTLKLSVVDFLAISPIREMKISHGQNNEYKQKWCSGFRW